MEISFKTKLKNLVEDYIVERKAMFIPIACVSAFMLVGYAAADKEKPVIVSNEIELPFGETLDVAAIEVTDNRDARDLINVEVITPLDTNQLGSNKVEVKATDQFSNEVTKVITVNVVDQAGPQIEVLGSNEGYVVQVPVKGSTDLASYVKAEDNVDGDVTPFIEADATLDTSKLGFQQITLSVSDSSGNETKETYEFAVADTEAPKIELLKGENVAFNFGDEFKLEELVKVTDNYDTNVNVKVDGAVDNKKENEQQKLKVIAKDASGNTSEATINVTVKDMVGPEIKLSKTTLSVDTGATVDGKEYLESAIDNKDGDIKDKVEISSIDTSRKGTKTITYRVTDEAGNASEATLSVEVNEVSSSTSSTEDGGNAASSINASSALEYALSRVGCAYASGGTGPTAFDCSGLTYWAFKQVGITIPRTSSAQAGGGSYVARGNLQPGDLVFYSYYSGGGVSHVAMYVGGGRVVHASTPTRGVLTDPLDMRGLYYVTARRY